MSGASNGRSLIPFAPIYLACLRRTREFFFTDENRKEVTTCAAHGFTRRRRARSLFAICAVRDCPPGILRSPQQSRNDDFCWSQRWHVGCVSRQ